MALVGDYESKRLERKAQLDKEFAEYLKSLGEPEEKFSSQPISPCSSPTPSSTSSTENAKPRKKYQPRTQRSRDSTYFPPPRRLSARIRKKAGEVTDENFNFDEPYERPNKSRRSENVVRYSSYTTPPSVDEITPEMLANIAVIGQAKVYSQVHGTSCHQCRQKTFDTKTICRSGKCIGGRGMLCQPCLLQRYGENVADALLNPTWSCPCCKGYCNQSNCLRKKGLNPTGCLFPYIGNYSCVSDYLKAMEAYPELPDDDKEDVKSVHANVSNISQEDDELGDQPKEEMNSTGKIRLTWNKGRDSEPAKSVQEVDGIIVYNNVRYSIF